MDPLLIPATAGSLTATVLALTETIGVFVSTVRSSRSDLDAVSRELVSLLVCLEILGNDQRNNLIFNQELGVFINQILVNVQACCSQVESMLMKLKTNQYGQPVKWTLTQTDQVKQLGLSLGTHKTALQVALQLVTIPILAKEVRSLPHHALVQQDDEMRLDMRQINAELEDIAQRQKDNPAVRNLQEALVKLSSSFRNIASQARILPSLRQQNWQLVHNTLTTIENVQGILAMQTEVKQMLCNPFVDPFSESDYLIGHEAQSTDSHSSVGHEPGLWILDERLRAHIQSPQHLCTQRHNSSGSSTPGSSYGTHWTARASTKIIENDMGDLLSENMSTPSSEDAADDNTSVRDSKSARSEVVITSSNAANKVRRSQSRYDAARGRIKDLATEITEFEQENVQLHETHKRNLKRWEAQLVQAQSALSYREALKEDNGESHDSAHGNEGVEKVVQKQCNNLRDMPQLTSNSAGTKADLPSEKPIQLKTQWEYHHVSENHIAFDMHWLPRHAHTYIATVECMPMSAHRRCNSFESGYPRNWSVVYFNRRAFYEIFLQRSPPSGSQKSTSQWSFTFPDRTHVADYHELLIYLFYDLVLYNNRSSFMDQVTWQQALDQFLSEEVTVFKDKRFEFRSNYVQRHCDSAPMIYDICWVSDKRQAGLYEKNFAPKNLFQASSYDELAQELWRKYYEISVRVCE